MLISVGGNDAKSASQIINFPAVKFKTAEQNKHKNGIKNHAKAKARKTKPLCLFVGPIVQMLFKLKAFAIAHLPQLKKMWNNKKNRIMFIISIAKRYQINSVH